MKFAMFALVASVIAQTASLPVRVIARGGQSGIEDARQAVATSAEQFASLWREHTSQPQPPVDFARESVIAIFLGTRRTAGYSVDIVSVTNDAAGTVVRYREQTPAPDALTAQVLTFPYVIAAVPRLLTTVRFESVR